MKTSYLTCISTDQFYGSKPVFDQAINFTDPNGPNGIGPVLNDAERLFLGPQRVFLEIDDVKIDFHDVVSKGPLPGAQDDREGAKILTEIAARLPKALTSNGQVAIAADHANFDVAGLLASTSFWGTVERAMIESLKQHSRTGDIRLDRASQKAMKVTTAKDGKSLLCTLSTKWSEFTQGNRLHSMSDGTPVLTTEVKIRIPFHAAGGPLHRDERYDLEARIEDVHHHSPLPDMLACVGRSKSTLGQWLLNLLSSIPLLGKIIRGVALRTGQDFNEEKWASVPAAFNQHLVLTGSQPDVITHPADYKALATHVLASRRSSKPNGAVTMTVRGNNVQKQERGSHVAYSTLKTALDTRPDGPLREPQRLLENYAANRVDDVAGLTRRIATLDETHAQWRIWGDHMEASQRALEEQNNTLTQENRDLSRTVLELREQLARKDEQLARKETKSLRKDLVLAQFATRVIDEAPDEASDMSSGGANGVDSKRGASSVGSDQDTALSNSGRPRANTMPWNRWGASPTTTTTTTSSDA
jgi:hypothetical protein